MVQKKRYFAKIANIKGQLNRSNAFWASKLRIRAGVFVLDNKSIRSIVHLVLSPACLVGIKPTWSLCINEGNIFESLLANIFVKML